MKPLLNKTIKPFLIYVLIIFMVSVPVYYFVIDNIWKSELDEHNKMAAFAVQYNFNRLKLSDVELEKNIELWNQVQPNSKLQKVGSDDDLKNRIYTETNKNIFIQSQEPDRFRILSTVVYINKKPYRLTTQTNIEESGETIGVIIIMTVFFFILIVVGLLLLTKKLSNSIWKPFQNTLAQLKKFNLTKQTELIFEPTDTLEFTELNDSLQKLIAQNVNVFKSQKEFTENASHELQTPLAILKNKLDILLQSEGLTEKQYHIAEEMHTALNRSSRINKNLLLLTKIESHQFDDTEIINLTELMNQSILIFEEYFEQKEMKIDTQIDQTITIKGNNGLVEVLINNLLLNAIRYTESKGNINIELSKNSLQISNSGHKSLNSDLVFKRFIQLSQEKSGSGLGLSIVEKITQFHHWNISYQFENNRHIFSIAF